MTQPDPIGTWPPTLDVLKTDAGIPLDDERDDDKLTQTLEAAIVLIERVHSGRYDFAGESGSPLPGPDAAMILGTCRMAARWNTRRRSPDALVSMGEMGAGRVPSFDVDIDRMCRLGRFAPAVFA
jgi:hypothetical protein